MSDDLCKCESVCGQAPTQGTQGQQGAGGRKRVKCLVMSRIVGYYADTGSYNVGKRQEFKDRKVYDIPDPVRQQVAADSLGVAEARKAAQHD